MNVQGTIKSPYKRKRPVDGDRINNGRKLAEKTRVWMESHETTYRIIKKYIETSKPSMCNRSVFKTYCQLSNIEISDNETYRFDHDLWAGIVRYISLDDPKLQPKIRMRESDIDCFGLFPISYLNLEDEC